MTGDGQPDPNGYYFEAGEYEGEPYYLRQDSAFSIWKTGGLWIISLGPGVVLPDYFVKFIGADPPGVYDPLTVWTGQATVAAVE